MNDVSKNIRAYAFTVLNGNITFDSANVPCFTKAPPNHGFPYVIIKTGPFSPEHTKDKTGGVYQLLVEVNTRFEKNYGGQDDVDDISDIILGLLAPLGANTSNFGSDTMYILTGPDMRPLEDDDDEYHYYTKLLTYEVRVLEN